VPPVIEEPPQTPRTDIDELIRLQLLPAFEAFEKIDNAYRALTSRNNVLSREIELAAFRNKFEKKRLEALKADSAKLRAKYLRLEQAV
jgi:hypothetical protein